MADSFIARTITGSRLNVRGTPIGPRSGPDVKKPLKRDLFQGPEIKFPPRFEDFIRCVRIKFAELDLRVYVFFIAEWEIPLGLRPFDEGFSISRCSLSWKAEWSGSG